jgi:hypothetical protein
VKDVESLGIRDSIKDNLDQDEMAKRLMRLAIQTNELDDPATTAAANLSIDVDDKPEVKPAELSNYPEEKPEIKPTEHGKYNYTKPEDY